MNRSVLHGENLPLINSGVKKSKVNEREKILYELAMKVEQIKEAIQNALHFQVTEKGTKILKELNLSAAFEEYKQLRDQEGEIEKKISVLKNKENRSDSEEDELLSLQENQKDLQKETNRLREKFTPFEEKLNQFSQIIQNILEGMRKALSVVIQNIS